MFRRGSLNAVRHDDVTDAPPFSLRMGIVNSSYNMKIPTCLKREIALI